ncbi:MAG TPA: response regulator transcription factor [Phaeodactylibacter sp.]|nr:response regulator transcription factor [Phaeodactylibacter sp.]
MKKIKVLLVDDEFLALNLLEDFVKKIPDLEMLNRVKSPIQAVSILEQGEVDLLFLDIQMPTLSGTNLLKTLKQKPVTIFTTAYAEYAVDAFALDAVDYLLKPFSFERFLQAVNKAKTQIFAQQKEVAAASSSKEKFLTIKSDHKLIKVFLKDILFIEGLREYVRIVTATEKIVTLERLKNLEEQLASENFLRVHKSYLINISKVKSVEGNRLQITTHQIPISREKKEMVTKRIF